MKITWHGHACFTLESEGSVVAIDPYTMDSYPQLQLSADAVYCSHGHYDHNHVEAITLSGSTANAFTVEEMASFHDDQNGQLRGQNLMRAFCAEGLRVIHCGDLGHELTPEQSAFLHNCDVLMIPVGGYYTIDAATAAQIAKASAARIVIPMHYRHGEHGPAVLSEADAFTTLFPASEVSFLKSNSLSVDQNTPAGIKVFQFQ